jgi:Do/DeqQ family serine protease
LINTEAMKKFLPICAVSLLSAIFAILGYRMVEEPRQVLVKQVVPASYAHLDELQEETAPLEQVAPSSNVKVNSFTHAAYRGTKAVVAIQALSSGGYWRSEMRGSSSGSGVIIDPDGYIATNNHVISEGTEIQVTLNNQREYRATVIGKDPTTDLALLKIDATNLPYLEFGNSDSVFLGEWVLAVGNPFRLQSTVTAGIVSAKGRNIQILPNAGIESFIQTDAAVNPGNSGGALLNTDGDLIGINTAIITYSGQYEGFSFAIPGNLARKVLADLKKHGSVQRGWLGVTITPVDNSIAEQLGLKKVAGVYLESVIEGSAAATGGLKPGDVILSVNDIELNSTPEFMEQVGRRRPGDKLDIRYFRKVSEKRTEVILSDQRSVASSIISTPENVLAAIGIEVRELTQTEKNRMRVKGKGVYVEKVVKGSVMERTNMEPEYIITTVNKKPVDNINDLVAEINKVDGTVVFEGFYERLPTPYLYKFRKE